MNLKVAAAPVFAHIKALSFKRRGHADEWHAHTLRKRLDQARIPSLDGLRAVAVVLVFLYHFGVPGISGALGVEIFFTLSGFLITWLLLRENHQTGQVSFRHFYKRRMLRLFPAFYAYWCVGLAIYFLRRHPIPWASVVASALYLDNYRSALLPLVQGDFLSHTWSLAIEEQFYLLWPLLFFFLRKDLKRLSRVLVGIIVCAWVYRATIFLGFSVSDWYIYNAFETRIDQLAVGCLLAIGLFRGSIERVCRPITASPWLIPIVLGLTFVSAFLDQNHLYRHTIGYSLEPLLVAMAIIQLVYFADRIPGRAFNCSVMMYLGRISYSLYLYQGLTIDTAKRLTEGLPVPVQLAFTAGVTVAFAAVSYHVVEVGFRSWGRSFVRPREVVTHERVTEGNLAKAF